MNRTEMLFIISIFILAISVYLIMTSTIKTNEVINKCNDHWQKQYDKLNLQYRALKEINKEPLFNLSDLINISQD
jgi:cell division protein FtsL